MEDVFAVEPSYYSWMMQGDFPLYTKRKLEEIYARFTAKKNAEKQAAKPSQPKPVEQAQPQEIKRPEFKKNDNPRVDNKPFKKKEEPAKPVDDDMLQQLAMKFKKG